MAGQESLLERGGGGGGALEAKEMHVASLVPRTNARNYFLPHALFSFSQAISADILDRIFVGKSTFSYPQTTQCLKALGKSIYTCE